MVGVFCPAIAQAQWEEDAVMTRPMEGAYPQLPTLYEPIPAQYVQLGKQLETLKHRWQSSFLTTQALSAEANAKTSSPQSDIIFAEKLQRKIDRYYELLELREFAFAELEAKEMYAWVGEQYLATKPQADAEIRAIWLDRGAIVAAKNDAGLAKLFDRFATAGINLVFLETVNASYPIFPSQVAPEQNPLLNGWDPLASSIRLAHDRQMELHAWTWIFAAANQRHNELMGQPQDFLGPVLTAHPDWGAGDRQGNPFQPYSKKAFFDPANPELQQYLLDLLTEIATNYDVDGIQLDYIRYPFQERSRNEVYGFGDASRLQFRLQGYPDPVNMEIRDRHWKQWQEFRVAQVDQFVEKASTTLRQKRPDLILSAAVFPMPRDQRLDQIQQNWEAWVEAGHIDLLVPMTYAEDATDLATLTADVLATLPTSGTLLLPSVRLLNLDVGLAFDQLQLLRQLPTAGTAFFAASDLTPDLAENLGNSESPSISMLRSPLMAIANRFETIQREWQLTFPEQPWAIAATTLNQAFHTAAADPTRKNILLLQIQWEEFRQLSQPQLNAYQKQDPYQVQVWENRLKAIENIIYYGDRRLSLLP